MPVTSAMRPPRIRLGCLLALSGVVAAHATPPVYVKWDATGANDGTSWENAFTRLQSALDRREVWVARGTYRPTDGTGGVDPNLAFVVRNTHILGGFAG